MLKIGDIMTREVYVLRAETTTEEAAWALSVRGLGGAPVQDHRGRLVGVLSKGDLTDPERGSPPTGCQVRDLMTPALLALHPSESVMAAAALMVREGVRRIIVLDDVGNLCGIVTPTDVLRALVCGTLGADGLDREPALGTEAPAAAN